MLMIRLRRTGSRQAPTYRLVVSEHARTPQGPFVENLGTYDPGTNPVTVKIDVAKAEDWIRKGARPSPTVKDLLQLAKRQPS